MKDLKKCSHPKVSCVANSCNVQGIFVHAGSPREVKQNHCLLLKRFLKCETGTGSLVTSIKMEFF